MSDNKYNPTRKSKHGTPEQSAEYKTYRKRVVEAALKRIKYRPPTLDPVEQLLGRAEDVTIAVRDHIRPVLSAGGWKDKESLSALLFKLYQDAFHQAFSKEELEVLCTVMHCDIAWELIEADPWAKDKPDKLSGV